MGADGPDIAGAGHWHHGCFRHVVGRVRCIGVIVLVDITCDAVVCEQCLDLSVIEAGQCKVVPSVGQLGQFQRQQFLVPARIERQPIVGDDVGAFL